jgi:hypothetical protein
MEDIIQSMNITNENTMLNFVNNNIKYLVVFPDRKTKTYKTLNDIQKDTCINSSTISKKLKLTNNNIFQAKGGNYIFYIYKIN